MKFLHTSDWHLGAKLGDYSRLPEQREILKEIRQIADNEKVDFVIIAGDIFDTFNPSSEAVEVLYLELKKLASEGRRPVIVIAGNHDSPDRIKTVDPLAIECGIFIIGYPDFVQPEKIINEISISIPEEGIMLLKFPNNQEVNIIFTPYANENRLRRCLGFEDREQELTSLLTYRWEKLAKSYFTKDKINIFTAHLFMSDTKEINISEPDGERSILHPGGIEMLPSSAVPELTQYAALGHLHQSQTISDSQCPIVYSGSPIALGLSEENRQKYIVVAEVEPGEKTQYRTIPLKSGRRIIRKQFESVDEAVIWLNENKNCYVELIIKCDDFISADERKRLFDIHDGITALIPILGKEDNKKDSSDKIDNSPDITNSIEELFISFFQSEKGLPPDKEMLKIFRQVLSDQTEEEGDM